MAQSSSLAKNKSLKKEKTRHWKKSNLPSKRTINLALIGVQRTNPFAAILGSLVIIAAAAAFGKYLVFDRLNEVAQVEARVQALQEQLDAETQQLGELGDVKDIYAHYTYSGMTPGELQRADRMKVIELLDRLVLSEAVIGSWKLTGNELNVPIEGATLEQINQIVQTLQEDPMVSYCNVTTAATTDSFVDPKQLAEDSTVVGQVTVYLN